MRVSVAAVVLVAVVVLVGAPVRNHWKAIAHPTGERFGSGSRFCDASRSVV